MERRLVAVFIADVAGYSRLVGSDEEGTRHRLQADLQENFEPKIASYHGRLVKTMGDGILVEFQSVVDAVRCAVEIQRAQADLNAQRQDQHKLLFRIGINLGDVIVEADDIHGDGVNIAARLEGLAEPGGIVISGTAYDQVNTKVHVGFVDMGTPRVKNIAKPVRAYSVFLDPATAGSTLAAVPPSRWSWSWLVIAAALMPIIISAGIAAWLRPWAAGIETASIERMRMPLPDMPSLVVLPFANMSADPKQDYFADGMTDDLITELSKISGLFVIARNSSFAYKGKPVRIAQVAEDLGVRYVLEGSVQRAGDQVRINAQLIDALSGGHLWADHFDGSLADVFALQDKVTRHSADALALRLASPQRQSIGQQETRTLAAYDAFLRGWDYYRQATPRSYAEAIPQFELAIELDPNYSRAYAALAMVYARSFGRNWSSSIGISDSEALVRSKHYLRKAQGQPSALTHQAEAYYLLERGLYKEALSEFKEAIALDPSDSWSYAFSAYALTSAGRPDEATSYIKTAMRLDPRPPALFVYYLGVVQLGLGQFAEAAATLEEAKRLNPGDQYIYSALGAAYAHLNRKEDATAAIDQYNKLEVAQGGIPLTLSWCADCRMQSSEPLPNLEAGLRLAGVPEDLSSGTFADKNRLNADEVRKLVFGHHLHGRSRLTGVERAASVEESGAATMSGDWVTGIYPLSGGVARIDGSNLCLEFPVRTYCGPILRNPGGTSANENEYIWHVGESFRFSVPE